MSWADLAGAITIILLLVALFMLVVAFGIFLVSVIFEVPRYEFRNWWDRRRLVKAVRKAKTAGDREDAEAALANFTPRTRNTVWK